MMSDKSVPVWNYSGELTATDGQLVAKAGMVKAVWLTAGSGAAAILVLDDSATNIATFAAVTGSSEVFELPDPIKFDTDLGVTLSGAGAAFGVWFV